MNTISASSTFITQVKKELAISFRQSSEIARPLIFFVLTTSLFPIAVSPDPHLLATISSGVIWVAVLLSTTLALNSLFKPDFRDGTLEQLFLQGNPVIVLIMAKVLTHWLISGLPLVLASPLIAMMLHMPSESFSIMVMSLILGTPALSLLGAIGAALTLRVNHGSLLLIALILPIYFPVLIFGTGAVQSATLGLDPAANLLLLGAILLLAVMLAPFAIVHSLKISLN